jgi:integrase
VRLAALRPEHIQRYYTRLVSEGDGSGPLSAQTVLHHHTMLHGALRHAVRTGLIPRNPADAVEPPRPRRYEARTLTAEEAQTLLRAIAGTRWHAFVALAVTAGLRRGELLGLRWSDLDLDAGRLSVRQQVLRVRGQTTIEPVKTARSHRPVALSAGMAAVLREHRARQEEARRAAGELWQDHGLVFPRGDGRPANPSTVTHEFADLLERAGLPHVRLHDLRHTMATLLLAAGAHPKVVQERAGHATVDITLDLYSHVQPTLQDEAAARIEALVLGQGAGASTVTVRLRPEEAAALAAACRPGEGPAEAAGRLLRTCLGLPEPATAGSLAGSATTEMTTELSRTG